MKLFPRAKQQLGFTYLAVMFAIAVMGIMLAQTGLIWTQVGQRDKELELLFVGNAYRQAIMLYYLRTPNAAKQYPKSLDDLLIDNRYNPPQHYLRKRYRDPMTNQTEWDLIMAPEGGIMGVRSRLQAQTIKNHGFSYANQAFEGKDSYSEWEFVYREQTTEPPAKGGTEK